MQYTYALFASGLWFFGIGLTINVIGHSLVTLLGMPPIEAQVALYGRYYKRVYVLGLILAVVGTPIIFYLTWARNGT